MTETIQRCPSSATRAPRDGFDSAELLAFLTGRVARFKLPRSIDLMDTLPRDPNGKLYKRKLREPFWAGRERAI